MARKATDLLDVFRFGDEDGDERTRHDTARGNRRASPKKKRRDAREAGQRRGRWRVESLQLGRRQILLACSAVALLLMLSFVLGLSTGRAGQGATPGQAALHRKTPAYLVIRGTLPLLDPTTRKPILPSHVADILKRDYGLRRGQLQMHRADGQLVIDVGPFPSEAGAREYLRKSGLEMMHLYMKDPFRWPEYAPWQRAR